MRRTSFKKKLDSPPFCRCVRPRDFCDFFSLSTALSTRIKEGTRLKRWTIALLDTRSTNKEYSEKVALRRNRSRSRRYQQQESSLLTRASSALHFSDADSIRSCESSARFPSFGVFCYEKKTKPEHSFRQNVRLHQSTFLLPPFCEKGR